LVRAQAGVNGMELERRLNQRGLTLGHFPSSLPVATVGGLVSTRSSGQESTRHGSVEDMLLGLTVALPDGSLAEARAVPRSAGGEPLGEQPWERWLQHRFDLSAERLRDLLEPSGSYLDTIEVAATWAALPPLYRAVKGDLAATAQLVLCHFSHASAQGACAYF